jgi:hypothetical protein
MLMPSVIVECTNKPLVLNVVLLNIMAPIRGDVSFIFVYG